VSAKDAVERPKMAMTAKAFLKVNIKELLETLRFAV
jgi:hypothetical protein